jgi:hypothetical protein
MTALRQKRRTAWRTVGRRVAKYFQSKVHYGTVEAYEKPFWRIGSKDNDSKHYDDSDLVIHSKLYEERATLGGENTEDKE